MLGVQTPELSLAPRTHVKVRSRDMRLKFQCWGGRDRMGPGIHWPLRGSVRDRLRGQHGEKTGKDPPVWTVTRLYKVHTYTHQIKNPSEICNVLPTLSQ